MDHDLGSTENVSKSISHAVWTALGLDHFDLTLQSSQGALVAYREHQMAHLNTFAQCAARGIQYEPMVFSAQGGCESHAEGIIHQLARAIADAEGISKASAKSEIMEDIAISLARSAASAVIRRRPPRPDFPLAGIRRIVAGSGLALEP